MEASHKEPTAKSLQLITESRQQIINAKRNKAFSKRSYDFIHIHENPKDQLFTPMRMSPRYSFDLNSFKEEVNKRHSEQIERNQEIKDLFQKSSEEIETERNKKELDFSTCPAENNEDNEGEKSRFRYLCSCLRACSIM